MDAILRDHWGKPRTEKGAQQQVRNLAKFIRKAISDNWKSHEIVNYVKLSAFTNCIAWSPKELAEGEQHIYWRHQKRVAAAVKDGLIEMGREDAHYLGC